MYQFSTVNGWSKTAICAELKLKSLRVFQKFFSFQMFLLITWKYISFQYVTHKGFCVSSHSLLKLGGCLMANLPIYNRIVKILSKTLTLKPVFKWIPDLAWLCLETRENVLAKYCAVTQFWHKNSFSVRNHKNPHLNQQQILNGGAWQLRSYWECLNHFWT